MRRFQFYPQFDQMDCGPACLQMVAKHHGRFFQLRDLRSKSYVTRDGTSLQGISDAAEAIGFNTLGVTIPFEKLLEVPLPCIVHWNQNHFVVIYRIKRDRVYVADPSSGLVSFSSREFVKSWASSQDAGSEGVGVALLLEPKSNFLELQEPFEKRDKKTIWVLFSYLGKYKLLILQLTLGLLAGSLIQLALPFLTQSIVDVGINTQNVNFIYLVLAGQLMLFISRLAIDFIRRWILLHMSTRISISIVSDFLSKLFKLPISFFEMKMIGDILRRIEDNNRIERFLSASSLNIMFSFFNLVVFGVVLAFYHVPIFLVFFGMSALYVIYIISFMRKRGELDYKRFQEIANNQSSLIQTVQGMADIKMNNGETLKRWEWEKIQARLFNVTISSTRLQQFQDAGSLFLNETKNLIITVMAALSVIDGQITLGMMLAIQYIIGQLNVPINDFVSFTRDLQDAKISLQRIGEVNDQPDEDEFANDYSEENNLTKNLTIIIKDISFQYEGPHSPNVLNGIDLIIPEGKTTAIVGASGSGKTTLMKLLLRFYKPTQGIITVGGQNLNNLRPSIWRQKCGAVMQDGYIFADSIARNIALGDEQIDKERILHAVTIANIGDFIDSLPSGFNTKVGANGMGLSQGQKQRILIARAVYKNPEVLFFDEATSSLDATNERQIIENLVEFFKGKTVIVIAHRLSTVKNADQIVVLEKGEIVEVGTHYELTYSKGKYFELIKNQLELGT